jgi:hypothetical protein
VKSNVIKEKVVATGGYMIELTQDSERFSQDSSG